MGERHVQTRNERIVCTPENSDQPQARICALISLSLFFPEAEAAAERAKNAEAARLAAEGPGEGDLGALLAGVVDIVVMDAPRALYEPRRELPWGPAPTTGLTVAGSGERVAGKVQVLLFEVVVYLWVVACSFGELSREGELFKCLIIYGPSC